MQTAADAGWQLPLSLSACITFTAINYKQRLLVPAYFDCHQQLRFGMAEYRINDRKHILLPQVVLMINDALS